MRGSRRDQILAEEGTVILARNRPCRLRSDPALALASGCDDLAGNRRVRERDRGHALAASSTLNRLELGVAGNAVSASGVSGLETGDGQTLAG